MACDAKNDSRAPIDLVGVPYLPGVLTNEHETLVGMFRHRPRMAADAVAGTLGIDVPKFDQAQLSAADLPDLHPTEYRADAVVTLGNDNGGRPVFAVVVEVQLRRVVCRDRGVQVPATDRQTSLGGVDEGRQATQSERLRRSLHPCLGT